MTPSQVKRQRSERFTPFLFLIRYLSLSHLHHDKVESEVVNVCLRVLSRLQSSKGKCAEITRRTTRSVTARLYQSCLKIPKVPDDIFQSILDIIKADGDYKTLTSVARTNRAMYDLVIPMIYGVVVFKKGTVQERIAR